MSGRVSPFAALTGAEKQIKWLEVQSVRLPYVEGALEAPPPEMEKPAPKEERPTALEPPEQPQGCVQLGTAKLEFQKTRHQQYDAVIERMKQAEKRISLYEPIS